MHIPLGQGGELTGFLVILISATSDAAAVEEAGQKIERCQFTELLATFCRLSPMFCNIHCGYDGEEERYRIAKLNSQHFRLYLMGIRCRQ